MRPLVVVALVGAGMIGAAFQQDPLEAFGWLLAGVGVALAVALVVHLACGGDR